MLIPMRIEQLLQVVEISKTGSLNRASKNLSMSQPTLSLSIKRLEEELRFKVFDRSFKGMSLTPGGQELMELVGPLSEQLSLIPEFLTRYRQPAGTTLSVSNSYLKFVMSIYAETVEKFAPSGLQSHYKERNSGEVLEDVVGHHADIGVVYIVEETKSFMYQLFEQRGLTYTRLLNDGYWIIVGPKNPLYHERRQTVRPEDLEPYPIVVYEEKHRPALFQGFGRGVADPKSLIRVNNRASMTELVQTTDAINIGARSHAPYERTAFYPNLRSLDLMGVPGRQEIGWICRKDYTPNDAAQFFIARLQEICAEG